MLKLEYDKKEIEGVIDKIVKKTMNMDLTWGIMRCCLKPIIQGGHNLCKGSCSNRCACFCVCKWICTLTILPGRYSSIMRLFKRHYKAQ